MNHHRITLPLAGRCRQCRHIVEAGFDEAKPYLGYGYDLWHAACPHCKAIVELVNEDHFGGNLVHDF